MTGPEAVPADVETRRAVYDLAAAENLTWKARGMAGTVFRAWASEEESRTLTPKERRALRALLDAGTLRAVNGWKHTRGFVEPAPGRRRP